MDEGLKNTATPFTMEEEREPEREPEPEPELPEPIPAYPEDEEKQSGSYAAAGETGIKSKSFLH